MGKKAYEVQSDQQRKAGRAQVVPDQDSSVRLVSRLDIDPERPFKGVEAISRRLYNGSQEIHTTNLEIGHDKSIPKDKKEAVSKATQEQMTYGLLNFLHKMPYLNRPPNFIGPSEQSNNGIETILVHGTFNATAAEVGWTSPNGKYADIVRERFGGKVSALQWSGKNHRLARIEAAQTLAKKIDENTRAGIITNVIAHSHGGNVAFEAIKLTQGNIEQLVTLGTPIRGDHLPPTKKLRETVEHYIHISGGKDTIAPKGGLDFVTPFKDNFSQKMGFNKAKISNPLANTELHVADATHSELHSKAVLGLLTAITQATRL
ncbi:esterase/lipase family protein [Mycetohabitans endofungorum]|uniref:esterase/lipase family protein n=1 Tax=Mycetohabitans endofungorum TaxID=417203 RepID=UPI002B055DBD|nr:hypothetical protein [Mycetohabitans endofungorum]